MKTETRTTRGSLLIKTLTATTVMAACAALFACGGSGGESANTTTPAGPSVGSVAVGSFVDAPVAGLAYESGPLNGLTDVNGKFSYIVGSPVTFKVGDIVVGSATGTGVLTPISLAGNGASATSPMVVAIVQFLNAIATVDGNGNLNIPESATKALVGKSIDFNAADAAIQVATVAGLVAPSKTLLKVSEASTHMTSSLCRLASGSYSGTWNAPASVPSSGSFTVTIDSSCSMHGIAMLGKTVVDVTSTMSSELVENSTYAIKGTVSNGARWTGEIDLGNKKINGRALYDGVNATFSAAHGNVDD